MNAHDEKRRRDLIKSLLTAKEKADTARLYLVANDRDQMGIWNTGLALEHIEIALGHLGVTKDATSNS